MLLFHSEPNPEKFWEVRVRCVGGAPGPLNKSQFPYLLWTCLLRNVVRVQERAEGLHASTQRSNRAAPGAKLSWWASSQRLDQNFELVEAQPHLVDFQPQPPLPTANTMGSLYPVAAASTGVV
jgi:hypothetical protein